MTSDALLVSLENIEYELRTQLRVLSFFPCDYRYARIVDGDKERIAQIAFWAAGRAADEEDNVDEPVVVPYELTRDGICSRLDTYPGPVRYAGTRDELEVE